MRLVSSPLPQVRYMRFIILLYMHIYTWACFYLISDTHNNILKISISPQIHKHTHTHNILKRLVKRYSFYYYLLKVSNLLPFWVPDVLYQHSEVVLWNLLSIQMFFQWICGGESGLPVLFLLHLRTASLLKVKKKFIAVNQKLNCIQSFATPRTITCHAPLFSTVSSSLLKFMSIQSVMLSNHLTFCHPLYFCFQSFLSSGSFQMSQIFQSGSPNIGSSASQSIVPMNIQAWFPLWLTDLITLLSWQPTPVFLPGEFHGEDWQAAVHGVAKSGTWLSNSYFHTFTCCPRISQESSPAPQFQSINYLVLILLYGPTLTSIYG